MTKDRGQEFLMVSLRFKHDTGLTMIEIMKMMREELDKANVSANGKRVRTNLDNFPKETQGKSPRDVFQRS